MSAPSCKICSYCIPASWEKAAIAYVQCVAPIEMPVVPTCNDAHAFLRNAILEARREPRNWTTKAHVDGNISGLPPAGWNCALYRQRTDHSEAA